MTQPRGEQERTEPGISLDSSFTPHERLAMPWVSFLPTHPREEAGKRHEDVCKRQTQGSDLQRGAGPQNPRRGRQCKETHVGQHTGLGACAGGAPAPLRLQEWPQNHRLSTSSYWRVIGNHRLPGDSGPDGPWARPCGGTEVPRVQPGQRTHWPSQFRTPILRLPFPPKPVNHTHRVSPFPRCPCEVPMSQSHPSTGAPILEIRLFWPPKSRQCSDYRWENNPILAEDATPEPTGDLWSNFPQARSGGGTKEVPLHPPRKKNTSRALGQQGGGCYEAPSSKPGPTSGKGTGTSRPNIFLGQAEHGTTREQRPQQHGPSVAPGAGRGRLCLPALQQRAWGAPLLRAWGAGEGKDQEPSSSLAPPRRRLSAFASVAHLLPDQRRDGGIPLLPPEQRAPAHPQGSASPLFGLFIWLFGLFIWVIIPSSAEAHMKLTEPP